MQNHSRQSEKQGEIQTNTKRWTDKQTCRVRARQIVWEQDTEKDSQD